MQQSLDTGELQNFWEQNVSRIQLVQPNNFCMPIRPSSAICFSGHKLQQYRFSKCKRTIILIKKKTRCGLNIRTLSRIRNLFFVLLPGGLQSQGFHSLQAVRLAGLAIDNGSVHTPKVPQPFLFWIQRPQWERIRQVKLGGISRDILWPIPVSLERESWNIADQKDGGARGKRKRKGR